MIVDTASRLAERGVESLWVWDHLVPFTSAPPDVAWEAWVTLGAMAREMRGSGTSIGVLVSPLTFREPAILARSAATVSSLSGSTFVLGVGAGGFVHDDALVGTSLGIADRMRRFAARVVTLRKQVDEVCARTGGDVRVWLGGDGEKVTIPLAARHADGWSGFGPVERFASRRESFDRLARSFGRDTSALVRSVLVTRNDATTSLDQWIDAGADEVVVSVRPDSSGGFDTSIVDSLLAQRRNGLRR